VCHVRSGRFIDLLGMKNLKQFFVVDIFANKTDCIE
jgi:hypothetical protein